MLRGAALGKANTQIGAEPYISVETVRTHMKDVLRPLGAVDRTPAGGCRDRKTPARQQLIPRSAAVGGRSER